MTQQGHGHVENQNDGNWKVPNGTMLTEVGNWGNNEVMYVVLNRDSEMKYMVLGCTYAMDFSWIWWRPRLGIFLHPTWNMVGSVKHSYDW